MSRDGPILIGVLAVLADTDGLVFAEGGIGGFREMGFSHGRRAHLERDGHATHEPFAGLGRARLDGFRALVTLGRIQMRIAHQGRRRGMGRANHFESRGGVQSRSGERGEAHEMNGDRCETGEHDVFHS